MTGTARVDRRTSSLLGRLRPGDIAVIDHLDLDRATAEALVDRGVAAVVNASPFISGRYANLGPQLLARSGVVMVDNVGTEVFGRLRDGSSLRLEQGDLFVRDTRVAAGHLLAGDEVTERMDHARADLTTQLESLTHNTTEFLRREHDLLLHGQGLPMLRTQFKGRPAVVVSRGYHYREDLRRLRRYIREQRPLLVAVDAGADALLAVGHRPDVLVLGAEARQPRSGDPARSVSDRALRSAREVVLHVDRSGRAPAGDRLQRLGIRAHTLTASGATEDVALLLADFKGAALIVAVGSHANLDEFLDRQRSGLASTFLTRLRVGPKLVDARGVTLLYAGRLRLWQLVLVLIAGLVAVGAAIAATPVGQGWWTVISTGFAGLN